MVKLVAVIALLGILFLPFAFLYQGWSLELYQHRKAVKAQLLANTPDEELITLSFLRQQAEDLNWEHEREFQYNGEWYDIIRTDTVGDILIYRCWWDHEETQLYRKLETLLAQHYGPSNSDTPQELRCQELLQHFFCSFGDSNDFDLATLPLFTHTTHLPMPLHFILPPTPPPKV